MLENPLEGLFGNTPEAKLWEFLIGTPDYDYTKKELAENSEISRKTVYKIIVKFLEWGILKETRKIGRATLYKLNEKNSLVKAVLEFNNRLIDIITKEELEKNGENFVEHSQSVEQTPITA